MSLSLAFGAACGDDGIQPQGGGGANAGGAGGAGANTQSTGSVGGAGGAAPVCGSANGELPAGLETLAWDDSSAATNVREQTFSITVNGSTFTLNDEELNEAVRFDVEHPSVIHGFSVHWGAVDGLAPETELTAGLYADFGYNGFDFWAAEPLFTGTRCAGDLDADGWVTYVIDPPITLEHPGLVYVAHLAEPGSPVFDFDGSTQGAGDCALWDECHSAMNLPKRLLSSFYNGVSFPFQYDYLVRLHLEHTEEVDPAARVFQITDPAFPPSEHVSFGDYDADGYDDVLGSGPRLYKNVGDGSFTEVTAASLVATDAVGAPIAATGGVFGDYDNDGCLDVFLYAEAYDKPDKLMRSRCDGTFEDATPASGIVDTQTYESCGDPALNTRSPTAAAAWLDLDADGYLDLYLANFICWANETFYEDEVWHNRGDGTFESWTAQYGFSSKRTASRGAAPADYDGDGDVDLFVNNYRLQANFLFVNQGDGTFVESAKALGAAGSLSSGYYGHTIGAAWGDLDGDLRLDLVSANLAHPRFFDFSDRTEILLQQPDGSFVNLAETTDLTNPAGLRYQETHSVPALADFDNDGRLDLVITAVYDGRPTDFYWGNGDGTFRLDAYHAGLTTENGWGISTSDFDNDGDVDTFLRYPFRNAKSQTGHFAEVKVVGNVASNRAAVGATVWLTAGGVTQLRVVSGGNGKGGQDSAYLHYGLGAASAVESVEVRFPGGAVVEVSGPLPADARIWVFEDGHYETGWAPQ
ncbi:MAG: CRTAC1 family protein [Polyangiaceae bacterium]